MLVRWVGGKSKLAETIIGTFPPHKRYIEPFFGGGWVFFKKQLVKENVLNDINSDLVNLYLTVRDQPQELARLMHYTIKHEDLFEHYVDLFWNRKEEWMKQPQAMRAMIYLYLIKNSFNSLMRNLAVFSTGWQGEGVIETMWAVSEKLKGVEFVNRDYKDVLASYANSNTLVYLDPPYAVTIKEKDYYYQYVMNKEEHEQLRDILTAKAVDYNWVLSYDLHPFVTELYKNLPGVYLNETGKVFQSSINKNNKTAGDADRSEAFKSEYLITNFPIQESLPLFSTQD